MGLNRIHLIIISLTLISALGFVVWLKAPFPLGQLSGNEANALDEEIVKTPPRAQ